MSGEGAVAMKLSEKIATMVWAFGSGDVRRCDVRDLADEVEKLEQALEEARAPVAHAHSPIVVDEAKPGTDQTIAVLRMPVDERKVAEAYREKVLAAFIKWGQRYGDQRTVEQVVLSVDLP